MKSMFVGVGMVVAAASLGLVSCGDDAATTGSTVVRITETNYVTIPPAPVTVAPVTTGVDAPGSILTVETEYVIVEGDYPSTVAAKFKVKFEDLMTLNGWTIGDNGIVPEWPGVGQTIRIPAGATVPGEPVDTATTAGEDTPATTTATTVAPATTTTVADVEGEACGTYTIEAGDYPGLVATKLDTTVAKLDAVNSATSGYSSFYVGLVIKVPC